MSLAVAVPEAGVTGVDSGPDGGILPAAAPAILALCDRARSMAVGLGLMDPDATGGLLAELLPGLPEECVVVLDALALGCVGNDPSLVEGLAGRLVMTPNAAEAGRLLGGEAAGDDVATARAISERYGAVVAVHGTVAAPDGRLWLDETGQLGLGTSGSGDVLAGLVAGLAARGAPPEQAAVWGTHLHGAAGDRLASRIGRLGYLAREVLDEAPLVLAELQT